ncbi:MAG: DUF1738 domain-containing protein [Ignavibacteriae bacterium]|nr:DUF1738 domain-containing protein [Ignavibacteriota bacterium]MCB9215697.1 DUF1738 domain-containing protein [Ignavibacteria bacterium]
MTTRDDLYTTITQQIIADLEKGELTWRKPWDSDHLVTLPLRKNDIPYSGINTVMLWVQAMKKGYRSPYWMTYRQAQEMKAHVRKGEKSTTIVYFDTVNANVTEPDGSVSNKRIPFLKRYSVFNAEQIEGLPEAFTQPPAGKITNPDEQIAGIEAFFAKTQAEVVIGVKAAYNPVFDCIQMPPFDCFEDARSYYATLAHELIHWTGHESRLRRTFNQKAAKEEDYAKEELIAELGACFLAADLGLEPMVHAEHAAYIQSWLAALKHDKRFVFHAAAQAQRAVAYLKELQEESEDRPVTQASVFVPAPSPVTPIPVSHRLPPKPPSP